MDIDQAISILNKYRFGIPTGDEEYSFQWVKEVDSWEDATYGAELCRWFTSDGNMEGVYINRLAFYPQYVTIAIAEKLERDNETK